MLLWFDVVKKRMEKMKRDGSQAGKEEKRLLGENRGMGQVST